MRASEIRDRARSLSDLQNSEAITYQDEISSINESYKDVYNKLTQSDADYSVEEVVLDDWTIYQDPTNIFAYNLPLPVDFYQLRFVDYMSSEGTWMPMAHMNINQRNLNSTEPLYRLKNSKIWMIIGSGTNSPASIKISYYPKPEVITIPDLPLYYNTSIEPYKSATTSNNWYIPEIKDHTGTSITPDVQLYNYDGKIWAQSQLLQTNTELLTAANVDQIEYYKGWVYYLQGGTIYRSSYDPSSSITISPLAITLQGQSISGITHFNIYNNKLYATNSTTSIEANVDGSSSVLYMGTIQPAIFPYAIDLNYTIYIDGLGQLIARGLGIVDPGVVVSSPLTWTSLGGDGKVLFGVDDNKNMYQLEFDWTDPLIPVLTTTLAQEDVSYIGAPSGHRISLVRSNVIGNEAVSALVDKDLSYPSNALYEILAHQMAIDFKRKYESDNADLNQRLAALWDTFLHSAIKQDQYKVERIQNVRQIYSNYGWVR
jgi:hypothetical protein